MSNALPVRIVIADDHPLLRQALKTVIEKEPELRVVGEASDGNEALKLVGQYSPCVVVMDISMPGLNGLEATRIIKSKYPETSILVLTIHDDNEHILSILKAGASGYLTKSVFGDEVVQAIRNVSDGDAVLSPKISKQLIQHALRHSIGMNPNDVKGELSEREKEILKLTAKGSTNKEIAREINLSERTVKAYLAEIFFKLNVNNRTEAAIAALHSGIISLDD